MNFNIAILVAQGSFRRKNAMCVLEYNFFFFNRAFAMLYTAQVSRRIWFCHNRFSTNFQVKGYDMVDKIK
jgi:hypothetical protein